MSNEFVLSDPLVCLTCGCQRFENVRTQRDMRTTTNGSQVMTLESITLVCIACDEALCIRAIEVLSDD